MWFFFSSPCLFAFYIWYDWIRPGAQKSSRFERGVLGGDPRTWRQGKELNMMIKYENRFVRLIVFPCFLSLALCPPVGVSSLEASSIRFKTAYSNRSICMLSLLVCLHVAACTNCTRALKRYDFRFFFPFRWRRYDLQFYPGAMRQNFCLWFVTTMTMSIRLCMLFYSDWKRSRRISIHSWR